MELFVGTSGFSYDEWRGSFYPEGLPADEMLAFYARQFPAVEINNTFYRLPKAAMLERWREQVPPEFRFVLKASQRITHQKRLKEVAEPLGYLLETARVLGARLGPFLFQLPPFMRCDVERLAAFLDLLPAVVGAAFEFLHASWHTEEVHATLRSRGAALCLADNDDAPPPELVATAGFAYLRLRRQDYGDDDLHRWAAALRGGAFASAYVFFKHEDEGAGPRLAHRFRASFDAL